MTDIPPRWYCVDRHGMTTLCADEDNARAEAAENDILWPSNAPHTAVQLAPVPAQGAEGVEALAQELCNSYATEDHDDAPAHSWTFSAEGLHEFARRLRNSPQPVAGQADTDILKLADYLRDAGHPDDGDAQLTLQALAERLRNSPESPDGSVRVSTGTVGDISDDELLRRAVRIVARSSPRKKPAWAKIMDVFALGSTYSAQLCQRFRVDPDTGDDLPKPIDTARSAGGDDEA